MKLSLVILTVFVVAVSATTYPCHREDTLPCDPSGLTEPLVNLEDSNWEIIDQTNGDKYIFDNLLGMITTIANTPLRDANIAVSSTIPSTNLQQLKMMATKYNLSKLVAAINALRTA